MIYKKTYTPTIAWPKIQSYCSYQERSHAEVKQKLYGYGLRKTDVEELMARLIEENLLNEERFALGFARGKFRIKKWGRIKIKYELKQKQVSDYNIRMDLTEIDEEEYRQTISKLAEKKWNALEKSTPDRVTRKSKINGWLMQKGYEPMIVRLVVTDLSSTANPGTKQKSID